jgi:hypothetical protein
MFSIFVLSFIGHKQHISFMNQSHTSKRRKLQQEDFSTEITKEYSTEIVEIAINIYNFLQENPIFNKNGQRLKGSKAVASLMGGPSVVTTIKRWIKRHHKEGQQPKLEKGGQRQEVTKITQEIGDFILDYYEGKSTYYLYEVKSK